MARKKKNSTSTTKVDSSTSYVIPPLSVTTPTTTATQIGSLKPAESAAQNDYFFVFPSELNTTGTNSNTTDVLDARGILYPFGKIPTLPTCKCEDDILIDFNCGARVYIPVTATDKYRVRVLASDYNVCIIDSEVSPGAMVTSSKRFYISYKVEVFRIGNPEPFITQTSNLKNKLVLIQCVDGGIGDTIAWFSNVEKFVKKHQCRTIVAMREDLIPLFKSQYPNMRFIKKEETGFYKPFATYFMGLFFNRDKDFQPIDFKLIGLHEASAYILDVPKEYTAPKVDLSAPRQIKEKYVVISTKSTTHCKHWNNPFGWIKLINLLKADGYRVICIDKEIVSVHNSGVSTTIPYGCEDFTGDIPLQERINIIKDADFFIGLSSGLSWLAWCCKVPVVLISGFTEKYNEFYTPYRILNPIACHGCWNDALEDFDHRDYMYCPKKKGTGDAFECTLSISPEHVYNVVTTIPTFRGKE